MKIVAISGMMGTGKSTLCNALAQKTGWIVVREDVNQNPFLPLYYNDPSRWALASQFTFMMNKTEALVRCLTQQADVLLIDRTIQEDMFVFASVFKKYDILTSHEHVLIQRIYDRLLPSWPAIDLTVYLEDTDENCFQRLLSRGDAFEADMEIGYVRSVGSEYRLWREKFLKAPYYQVYPEAVDFRQDDSAAAILSNIRMLLGLTNSAREQFVVDKF